jgi:glycine/D-amino acid oxidase-like deaminating enzyme/nitrite reductase/ring-hydroxylating ferredoxin subunit
MTPDSPTHTRHESIWLDTTPRSDFGTLERSLRVDTVVVGGGIAGISAAHELDAAGQRVALLERDRIIEGATGRSTAKVTSQHGLIYDSLIDTVGEQAASQYADANQAAIETIADTVAEYDIDCGFDRAPAYTYVRPGEDDEEIRDEVRAARRLDIPANFASETGLPYDTGGAVEFPDQAYFDPRSYLLELAGRIDDGDSRVREGTTVEAIEGGSRCRVETDRGTVTASNVVVATHFPVRDDALYFNRLSPKRSYVLAVELAGKAPEGMHYYPHEPYFSVRPHGEDDSLVLLGGQNHRTGQGGPTSERYRALESAARERFDVESVRYRWATQDYVSIDSIPFVGPAAPQTENVYVATGFGGWGMTNGTAAGRILADYVLDRENPWADVFHPTRLNPKASARSLLDHSAEAATHMIGDRLASRPSPELATLGRDEAKVFDGEDEPIAAYRDTDGELHTVSAVCPHMGCLVAWNDGERSWDCPCHGSRFGVEGDVLDTPAAETLEQIDVSTIDHHQSPTE